jgi:hypothetical protein
MLRINKYLPTCLSHLSGVRNSVVRESRYSVEPDLPSVRMRQFVHSRLNAVLVQQAVLFKHAVAPDPCLE